MNVLCCNVLALYDTKAKNMHALSMKSITQFRKIYNGVSDKNRRKNCYEISQVNKSNLTT